MIGLAPNAALLAVWIVFSALVLAGVVAVLVWAVRSGQFSQQDMARRLPLESGIPPDRPAPPSLLGPAASHLPADVPPPAAPPEKGGRDDAQP
jgi:nitrogen fixation-related uncharacterized protein